MKARCPVCGERKAQRDCHRQAGQSICGPCCAGLRGAECGDCRHYAAAERYAADRRRSGEPPGGDFLIEIDPEVEDAVNAALDLARRGRRGKAAKALEGLLAEHPRNHIVCFGAGTLCALQEDHAAAIEWFDKALAIYPYFVEAHFNKAVAHQKLLDLAGTIRAYRKVVQFGEPEDETTRHARSFLDDLAAAIRRDEGVDLDTYMESQDAFNQAFAAMERRDWGRALAGFRAAAAKNDRNAPTHGNMGLCLAWLGRKAEALAALDRALAVDPDYQPARTNRAVVERMEEGRPLGVDFMSIDYARQQLERSRRRPPETV